MLVMNCHRMIRTGLSHTSTVGMVINVYVQYIIKNAWGMRRKIILLMPQFRFCLSPVLLCQIFLKAQNVRYITSRRMIMAPPAIPVKSIAAPMMNVVVPPATAIIISPAISFVLSGR